MRSQPRAAAQLSFPGLSQVDDAVAYLASAGIEERGAIFTRREVVDFILDLVGYTADQPLHTFRLLEPSFGDGDFLLPALERLFAAYARAGRPGVTVLREAIRGVELHQVTYDRCVANVRHFLAGQGLPAGECQALITAWFRSGDFLLQDDLPTFTHVVGNPPYVRQEAVPEALMAEYRRRFTTIYDRADLYVPFIERALGLLAPRGALGFICADRWMKNRYGGPLREFVSRGYRLRTYVDMVDTQAFHTEVSAYPAIFVIAREPAGPTRLTHRPNLAPAALTALAAGLTGVVPHAAVTEVASVVREGEPWILESFDQLALVRRLEATFPSLEEAGCKVGIGVATGADQVFVSDYETLDVEPDRKLPLVMTKDILDGTVRWRGKGVINPFDANGRLVPLAQYPRLARYLEAHGAPLKNRHVAQKNPGSWYRTIDRIWLELTHKPKLLIPDIKGAAHIVYEGGQFYPHHNLYFITSESWDLRALQAVLMSGIARLFIATYSTKMRGGYLRFQAQYLRRIRVPHWHAVPDDLKAALKEAARRGDQAACDAAVFRLFGMTKAEREALGGNGG